MNPDLFYTVAIWQALITFGALLAMLVLQTRAFRRTRHGSFKPLLWSTVIALVLVPAGLFLQFRFQQRSAFALYVVLAALATLQAVLAVWGTGALLQAFSGTEDDTSSR